MRIVSTTLCYPDGRHPDQGIFVQRRCLALARMPGVSLRVVVPQLWCPLLRAAPRPGGVGPLPAHYPPMLSVPVLGWATDGLAFAHALETCIRADIETGRPPDVIDAHFEYPDGVGAWLAGRRLQVPVVVTLRGKIVSLSRKTLRRMQIARMLRGVAARIAVSRSLADWARRIGGAELEIAVIPNGIDSAVFHPQERTHARQSLRWNPDRRYVLCVGHQQHVKGFDRVLAAAPEVRAARPDARFVLVGSQRGAAAFRRKLQRLVSDCNRSSPPGDPAVQLLGPVPGHVLGLMYNAAEVLVNASRSEGWCNAINEALACGTPVVATSVGGNDEQVCSPELGILVPDGQADTLAAAITAALARSWNRERIASAGAARSWNDTAREACRVLSQAALHSMPGPPPLTEAAP